MPWGVKDMPNPLFPAYMLTHEETLYVRKLQRARSGARKAARSGHPGKRAEAVKAVDALNKMIKQVYINNYREGGA